MSQLQLVGKRRALNFDNFPAEILIEFLIRLSVWDLARARLTCKAWHSIISDTEFLNLHLKHSAKRLGYLFTFDSNLEHFIDRSSVSSSIDNKKFNVQKVKMKPRDGLKPHMNSSGGLLAYTIKKDSFCYVYNPIMGEEIKVAMGPFSGEGFRTNWCGLGYSGTSKEYKILLLAKPYTQGKGIQRICKGAIYTLGAGSAWREIPGDVPFNVCYDSRPLDFEGSLFWLVSRYCDWKDPKCIASFEVGSERFKLWKGPSTNMDAICCQMMSLLSICGTIAFSEINLIGGCSVSIWMLRDTVNEIWINEIKIAMPRCHYHHPTPMSPCHNRSTLRKTTVFGDWAVNNETFPCILLSFEDSLVIYKPKDESFKSLTSLVKKGRMPIRRAKCISHTASLVSPKRIMAVAVKKD